jgi:beta-galactosidase
MPFGVVFLPYPGMTEDDLRRHFRTMKSLGFNAIKQFMGTPEWSKRRLQEIALDEGICPFWYGEGGWDELTPDLLERLGIDPNTPIERLRTDPRVLAHQRDVMRRRIEQHARSESRPVAAHGNAEPWEGIPHTIGTELDEQHHPQFIAWLKARYRSIDALAAAWNLHHVGICPNQALPATWDDVPGLLKSIRQNEYRHLVDILRFKADNYLRQIERRVESSLDADPHEPVRAGGEMGLFLPFASRATDMEGIAALMSRGGSFYPSIHLAWHFEEVDFELPRTIYMQASLAADWFKGGWSATWESTGGPQQLSGGKAWDVFAAQKTAGFTVDAGTMTQLLLSYLAGGFRGAGLWAWNCRTAGWEAGEYGLLDRNGQVTDRARRAGAIAQAANRFRDELWQARKEPLVGVFQDFDNEAIWSAVATTGRDKFKFEPVHARVGVSRALIDANIPWEHVTARNLRRGLAARYRVIYLPAVLGLSADLLPILRRYVEQGGRLVLDMPGAWFDEYGKLLPTGPGSSFAELFGTTLDDFQYSSGNTPRQVGSLLASGFVADLTPVTARPVRAFTGASNRVAVTEHALGRGSAVILGWEASLMCFKPGNDNAQRLLVEHALGSQRSPYRSDAIVYRLAAPQADHYFLINDKPTRSTTLEVDFAYQGAEDAISGDPIDLSNPIVIEGFSGRWLRAVKT